MSLFSETLVVGVPFAPDVSMQAIESICPKPTDEMIELATRLGPGLFNGYYSLTLPPEIEFLPEHLISDGGAMVRHNIFSNDSDTTISLTQVNGTTKIVMEVRDIDKLAYFQTIEEALLALMTRDCVSLQNVHECYGQRQVYVGEESQDWKPGADFRLLTKVGDGTNFKEYWESVAMRHCYIVREAGGQVYAQYPRSLDEADVKKFRLLLPQQKGGET